MKSTTNMPTSLVPGLPIAAFLTFPAALGVVCSVLTLGAPASAYGIEFGATFSNELHYDANTGTFSWGPISHAEVVLEPGGGEDSVYIEITGSTSLEDQWNDRTDVLVDAITASDTITAPLDVNLDAGPDFRLELEIPEAAYSGSLETGEFSITAIDLGPLKEGTVTFGPAFGAAPPVTFDNLTVTTAAFNFQAPSMSLDATGALESFSASGTIVIGGEVAVPEPTSLGIVGLGIVSTCCVRFRTRALT